MSVHLGGRDKTALIASQTAQFMLRRGGSQKTGSLELVATALRVCRRVRAPCRWRHMLANESIYAVYSEEAEQILIPKELRSAPWHRVLLIFALW